MKLSWMSMRQNSKKISFGTGATPDTAIVIPGGNEDQVKRSAANGMNEIPGVHEIPWRSSTYRT